MSDSPHRLFPQPDGSTWCFCRQESCPGWVTYRRWHQAYTGTTADAVATRRDHATQAVPRQLGRRYQQIFGSPSALPLGAALDWFSWENRVNQDAGLGPVAATLPAAPASPWP